MVWFTELKSYLESFISNYLNVYVSIQSDPFKNHYSFNIFNWWRLSQSAQPWLQLNVFNVEENGCMKCCLQIFCSKGIETRAEIECLIRLFASFHYDDVIMTMLASQITSLVVVYSIVYLGVNQRKHQSSASLAFVREIHRGPVNFPHKWPVTRKMFPLDDVIMWRMFG